MRLPLKLLIHGIYWVVFIAFSIALSFSERSYPFNQNYLPHIILNTVWAVIIFYAFYGYFIEYFKKGKFVLYLLAGIISSIVITIVFIPIHSLFVSSFDYYDWQNMLPPVVGSFIIAQCGSLIRGFENWFDDIQFKAELENRNLKNEMELLKSQLNPHFLFNTINNIDVLIHKSPDEASRSLITLSDMLRYMIYETNHPTVPLKKELEYLKHFISLQKQRYRDPDFISLAVPATCDGIQVAPMLMIPFVENAFKFVATDVRYPAIEISITCDDRVLDFECKNHFHQHSVSKTHTGGVGLENVKRRLELIYKDKYTLNITKNDGLFHVSLKLQLS